MGLVCANTSFISTYYGRSEVINPSDIFDDDDPLVLDRPDMFSAVTATRKSEPRIVEQASAAPGEKRAGTKRP